MIRAVALAVMLLCARFAPAQSSCSPCHNVIASEYAKTAMGRSFALPSEANVREGVFAHPASAMEFRMVNRAGRYFQQGGATEREIHYVMGSGMHARTYLHRTTEGELKELPMAWYSEGGGTWGMNPGYDRADHPGFRRTVSTGCMFCHNAYPRAFSGTKPVFRGELPLGIDCERCHGSGARHLELARAGRGVAEVRTAIVNPARLPADRRMEVCLQCHLETTSFRLPGMIRRFNREPFSYRPGEPLENFALYFDHARESGRRDKVEIVGAAYRLRQSKCFVASAGRLQCTTCHDPHRGTRRLPDACRQCHAASAKAHYREGACVECHMPKRRTEDVVHAVVSDHAIPRHKPAGDLPAPAAERRDDYRGPVELYYPPRIALTPDSVLYQALAQVIQQSNLAEGLPRLEAAVSAHRPKEREFHVQLSAGYRLAGRPAKAVESLRRSIAMLPADAIPRYELGMALLDLKQIPDAIGAFREAIRLDPSMAEAHNSLGGALLSSGQVGAAEPALRTAIRLRSDYPEAHNNLAALLLSKGDLAGAERHYREAIQHQPGYRSAQLDLARLLARARRFAEARDLARIANAHSLLAAILSAEGDSAEAIESYREALRTDPRDGMSMIGLATELGRSGQVEEARQVLSTAAGHSDAKIRAAASELLGQLSGRR